MFFFVLFCFVLFCFFVRERIFFHLSPLYFILEALDVTEISNE